MEKGTKIANSANIFFDNNQPIATNTVINIITDKSQIPSNEGLQIFPNPALDYTMISLEENVPIQGIRVFDLKGKLVAEEPVIDEVTYQLNVKNLSQGVYSISTIDENGNQYVGKLVIIR